MGLRKVSDGQFSISPEEWNRRELRKHDIRQWCITICQISGLVAFILFSIWLFRWLGVV